MESETFFQQMVTVLAEAFRQSISPITIAAYEAALSDIPRPRLQAAAKLALRECKFMPSVSELRELSYRGSRDRQSEETFAMLDRHKREAIEKPCGPVLALLRSTVASLSLPEPAAKAGQAVRTTEAALRLTEKETENRRREILEQIEAAK